MLGHGDLLGVVPRGSEQCRPAAVDAVALSTPGCREAGVSGGGGAAGRAGACGRRQLRGLSPVRGFVSIAAPIVQAGPDVVGRVGAALPLVPGQHHATGGDTGQAGQPEELPEAHAA